MMKHFQANIWFVEKWRSYPRVKYFEAKKKMEVANMVKKEFPDYKELLIMEILAHPHEARNPEEDRLGVISIVEYSFEELLDDC